jgi:hypothetical protein
MSDRQIEELARGTQDLGRPFPWGQPHHHYRLLRDALRVEAELHAGERGVPQ